MRKSIHVLWLASLVVLIATLGSDLQAQTTITFDPRPPGGRVDIAGYTEAGIVFDDARSPGSIIAEGTSGVPSRVSFWRPSESTKLPTRTTSTRASGSSSSHGDPTSCSKGRSRVKNGGSSTSYYRTAPGRVASSRPVFANPLTCWRLPPQPIVEGRPRRLPLWAFLGTGSPIQTLLRTLGERANRASRCREPWLYVRNSICLVPSWVGIDDLAGC